MSDYSENGDDSDAVLIRLLKAAIEKMDQESGKMTDSGLPASNFESSARLEIPELRQSDDSIRAIDEEMLMGETSPGTLPSSLEQMRAIHPEPANLNSSRHETVGLPQYRVRFASPQLGIPQVNKRKRSKAQPLLPTSPSLEDRLEQCEISAEEAALDGKTCKGEIRTIEDGSIEWKDGDQWRPAVFHNSIREKLIKQAEQLGSYDHRRRHGLDPLDITCFHPDQKTWGPDRDNQWPLMPDQLLFRLERRGSPVPNYNVERWIDGGRVVLDIDNLPVKNYRNIPLTLSSELEAYLMETIIRMDVRIAHKDFRARMPHTVKTATGTKPLLSLSAIGMRMKRFRLENACPPWNEREGSGVLKNFVISLLSEGSLERNSTQELSGLTKLQQEFIKRQSRGQHLPRAGARQIDPTTRAKREEANERRWARLQAADKDQNEGSNGGEKRKRGIDSLLDFGHESPVLNIHKAKRARCGSAGLGELITKGPRTIEGGRLINLPLRTLAPSQALDTCSKDATADSDKAGFHEQSNSPSQREQDLAAVESALLITVADYNRWLGYDPPPTNPEDGFDIQYNDLQRDFNGQWNRDGPPPKLLCRKPILHRIWSSLRTAIPTYHKR